MTGAWHIWKERNNLVFHGFLPSVDSWKREFIIDLNLLVHRTKHQIHPFIASVVDFV
jgi:hypothetical protein